MTQEAFMILDGDILNSKVAILEAIAKQNTPIYIIGAILGILGVIIIINQIRIRKQLRRIQDQLEQKEDKDVS